HVAAAEEVVGKRDGERMRDGGRLTAPDQATEQRHAGGARPPDADPRPLEVDGDGHAGGPGTEVEVPELVGVEAVGRDDGEVGVGAGGGAGAGGDAQGDGTREGATADADGHEGVAGGGA